MKCIKHPKMEAVHICAVCKQRFCERCVLPHDQSTYICHDCAAAQFGRTQRNKIRQAEKERRKKTSFGLAPKMQLALIILCFAIAAIRLFTLEQVVMPEYEVDTAQPRALAAYCGRNLEDMIDGVNSPSRESVIAVCPPPLVLKESAKSFAVIAPDAVDYGFQKIVIDRVLVSMEVLK